MTWTNVLPGSGLYPDFLLEWAPTNSPRDETPTWVDITDRLRDLDWSYGRNDELAEFEPGHGFVVLDNNDRAFDPSYAASPWFGNIKPRRLFRLQSRWNAVTEGVFVAHARGYPQTYRSGDADKLVRIDLADDLALLRAVDLDALGFNRPQERSDERVNAILDEAGIPESRRDISDGTVTISAFVARETIGPIQGDITISALMPGSAWTQIKKVSTNSQGTPVFVSGSGFVKAL